jgi:type II secretory pathway component GspD/PulD (secretin)
MKTSWFVGALIAPLLTGLAVVPASQAVADERVKQVLIQARIVEHVTVKETGSAGFGVDWDLMRSASTGSGGVKPSLTLGAGFGNREHYDDRDHDNESGLSIDLNFSSIGSGGGDSITLEMLEDIGQNLGNVGFTGDGLVVSAPRRVTRDVNTMVVVADGESFVLGGLNEVRQDNYERVPSFGKIPIVGRLFKADVVGNQRRELVIIITTRAVQVR